MRKIVLIGAGGHALSVLDSVDRKRVAGFIDEYKVGTIRGFDILGNAVHEIENKEDYIYHIAIGDVPTRSRLYQIIKGLGLEIETIVDKTSTISTFSEKPFSLAVLRARSFLCCHGGYSFSYRGQYTLSDYCISGDTGYVVYNGEYIHCSNANHGTGAHGLLLYHSYIGDQSGKEMFRRRELKRVSVIFALLCIKLSYLFGYGLCRLILEY